ncbi:MAG: 4-hydroxy-tetrahydrodipicolinate synthase [Anaerobacillus sp.]|uniref:4-hydroxy-tetrahydrodipicolinate synthase n=1 Tax=Anaerobacillus sp. TaxID=1872506 RepID=UPI0039190AED
MNFGHLLTAMVTPFDQEGKIDFEATRVLVNYLIDNGTDGIVVAGTTGESPTLSIEEKAELFAFVVEVVSGRATVIAGTGTNCTATSIHLTEIASKAGVDGIMLVAPYYNKPNQEGLYLHFKTIAASTHLPVMLYNIPGRSGVNIKVETIVRLSQIENIVAVKEASGDLEAMATIIQNTPDDFYLYSGDDGLTLPVLAIGGHGVVSVSAHIIGNEMKQMITAFQNGDSQKAASLHRELLPIIKTMFIAPNPAPVKAALEMFGQNVGSVRLPLVPLSESELETVHGAVKSKLLTTVL